MKAIIKAEAGEGHLAWTDWPEPTPRPGYILVDIKQAGICSTDVAIYSGTYTGRRPIEFPSMLGHEAAGVVSRVSEGVDDVGIGDRVALQVIWGHPHAKPSLLGFENLDPDWFHVGASALGGAFAERIAVPADRVVLLPDSISWEDAALLEPVAVAAHAMELVALRAGETFVVVGPGPFGLLMCQIARSSGAARVIAVGLEGIDDARLEVAGRVGADSVITFAGDAAVTASEIANLTGGGADVVMDCGGTSDSTFLALEAAGPAGRIAIFGFTREARIEPLRQVVRKGLSLYGVSAAQRRHYGLALRMIESNMARPREIVSHRLPMSRAGEGIELMKTRAASKILLDLADESPSNL